MAVFLFLAAAQWIGIDPTLFPVVVVVVVVVVVIIILLLLLLLLLLPKLRDAGYN